MIKKQSLTIIICGLLAAALAAVYFLIVEPSLKTEEVPPVPIELVDGEVYASDVTKAYMFAPVERSQMKKIEVKNDKGGYTFYKQNSTFYIKNMETAPYDLTALSYLVTSTGSSVPLRRYVLEEGADLSVYGLGREDDPAYYIITTESGQTHKVWVGDQIPTGGGYYCQYDGRNVVYVIGSNLGLTIFSSVYDLITPTLGLPVEQSNYMLVSKLGILKNGVPLVQINTLTPEENGTSKTDTPTYSYEFDFTHLKSFTPNATTVSYIIQTMSGLAGSKTVAAGNEVTAEFLESKGISADKSYLTVYYRYNGEDAIIQISAPDEDGISYAYSTVYHIVVQIKLSTVPFHSWTLYNYIELNVFKLVISDARKIHITGFIEDEGISVDTKFALKKENDTQKLWDPDTGEQYDADEVENFRQIYAAMLRTYIAGETNVTDISTMDHIASFTVEDKDGNIKTYKFYAYNNARCFVTIDDKGYTVDDGGNIKTGFYVNRENVETLIRNTNNFNLGYTIDPGL